MNFTLSTLMTSQDPNFKMHSSNNNVLPLECTNSLIQIEMIARLNNMGCACLLEEQSCDLSQAGNYFRRAQEKVDDLLLFVEPSKAVGSTTNLHAVTEPSPSNQSLYVYQRGEYDEGMHIHSEPIILLPDVVSTKNAAATIAYNLGQLHLRLNSNQEAKNSFLRALQLGQWGSEYLGKAFSTGGVSLMATLHNIGHVQYRNGDYDDAIKTYSNILEILQRGGQNQCNIHSSNHLLELADALNCLGVCYFHQAGPNTEKALSFYQEALAIRRAVVGQDAQTKEIATYINNIGRVFYLKGEHAVALEHYQVALSMRRLLFGDDHLDVAAAMYNLGQTYHHSRELEKAMALYTQFLAIAKKRLGYYHRDVATMLKCMAQIKHECQHSKEASELYREAIQVGRAAMGEYHPEIASVLNKLGNLLYESGDLDGAAKVYQDGLKVERMVLEPDHPNIIITITNLAQIYKLQGEYDLALRFYQEAVAIQRRTCLDPSSTNMASTLSSMALIYYRTRRFTKALELYQEVLRMRREAHGDFHVEIGATLNSVGLVLFKMELHDYALQSFHESLRVRRQVLGPSHRDCAVVLYNLATCYLECGADDIAMQYYRESLSVEKAALGASNPDVILTMMHCGQVHQGRGELDDALDYYQQALDAQIKSGADTSDHVTMARIFNHIGNVFLQRGQAKAVVENLSRSLRHLMLAGKDENDLVLSGFNLYALSKKHPECAPAA